MNRNFYSLCRQQFDLQKTFLVTESEYFTYQDLDHCSAARAHWLVNAGLKPGDRVVVQVEKSAQNLFWYFACLRAGLIYLPLNTAYQPQELEYFTDNATPALIICDPDQRAVFESIASCQIETLNSIGEFSSLLPDSEDFLDVDVAADDVAAILYTSGTTGKPKGAMISHGNLFENARTLTQVWQWQRDDIMLHALPVFHVHGLFVASHLPVLNSSTILFRNRFSAESVIEALPKVSVYMGVPTHYTRLLQDPRFNQQTCINMRLFTSGSAPLLKQTFDQMVTQTGHQIVERYGMTETGMNTSNPVEGERKPGTVGPALPGVETRILNDDNQPVGIDSPGNLLVRGENVFQGYWQMPEKTAEEFTADGFFKTGDVAAIDEDGYISIVGRDKDMVISGGLNIYPKEIESIIDRIDGVLESAVIGMPHSDFGEAVTAIIVLGNDDLEHKALGPDDIMTLLRPQLANFKLPKKIYFTEALPRNTMGKVQKNILRDTYNGPA
jgi:malonyl-CoA/methylmalonyl-CoA synthetase